MLFAVFVEKTSGSAGPKSKSNREGRSSDASQAVYEARTKQVAPSQNDREEHQSDRHDEKQ